MLPKLSEVEARVIGCLMEKSVLTPDQYPMTLNALTNACNQKSGRDPVMSLEKFTVQRTVRQLDARHLVRIEENFRRGTEKYLQRFCNTRLADFRLDPPQFAILCVLLLRGPRTPGELKTNSGRLYEFADKDDVVNALNSLIDRDGDALVVKLPRTHGRRDSEYMHLLSGPVDVTARPVEAKPARAAGAAKPDDIAGLAERVSRLEAEVEKLKKQLTDP